MPENGLLGGLFLQVLPHGVAGDAEGVGDPGDGDVAGGGDLPQGNV